MKTQKPFEKKKKNMKNMKKKERKQNPKDNINDNKKKSPNEI